jgi:hypothetical protein
VGFEDVVELIPERHLILNEVIGPPQPAGRDGTIGAPPREN